MAQKAVGKSAPLFFSNDFGLTQFAAHQRGRAQAIDRFVEGDFLIGVLDGALETAMVIALSDVGALMLPMPNGGPPFWVANAGLANWRRPIPQGARLVEVIDSQTDEISWATYAPDLHSAITLRKALADARPDAKVIIETPYDEELNYLEGVDALDEEQMATPSACQP
jgi:hypothetical protein